MVLRLLCGQCAVPSHAIVVCIQNSLFMPLDGREHQTAIYNKVCYAYTDLAKEFSDKSKRETSKWKAAFHAFALD